MYTVRKKRNENCFCVKDLMGNLYSKHATRAEANKQVKILNLSGGARAKHVRVGMGLSKTELKDFIKASYAKKNTVKEVDGYKIDNSISTKKNKVYVNPEGKVIVANAGTSDLYDWTYNAYVPLGLYHTTSRYKDAEKIQKEVIDKYGKENITNVGHSQSGELLRNLADRGLTNEAVAFNPYIIGKKHEGVDVIRSSGDLVSMMTPYVKETIPSKTRNPYTEHMPDVLGRGKKGAGFVRGLSNFGNSLMPVLNFMKPTYLDSFGKIPETIGRLGGKRYTPLQFGKDFVTISTLGLAPQGRIGGKSKINKKRINN